MKKTICIIICLVSLLCVFCGCQKTPETPIVVGKNQKTMIEKAKEKQETTEKPKEETEELVEEPEISEEEIRLRETLGIPERYVKTMESDKLKVVIDAEVNVPAKSKFPIARVKGVNFTQEQVTAFYDALCGDVLMYPAEEMTKEEIEARVIEFQQKIASAKDENEAKLWEEAIKEEQKYYADAPSEAELQPDKDSTLQIREINTPGMHPGELTNLIKSEKKDDGKTFLVENNATYKKKSESVSYEDEQGNLQTVGQNRSCNARMDYDREMNAKKMINNGSPYFRADVTRQSLSGAAFDEANLTITPKEARMIIEELLKQTNCEDEFIISEVTLVADSPMDVGDDVPLWRLTGFASEEKWKAAGSPQTHPRELHAYQFKLLRTVGGIGVDFDVEMTAIDDESYDAEWWNEALYITVDDEGIRELRWNAPLEVQEIITEDSALLSFAEVCKIFEKMFFVKYEAKAAETQEETEYRITKAKLSLMRIREANAVASGLVVPVWNFYGYGIYDGESYEGELSLPRLTINAIDGSIIDINRGY